MSALKNPEIKLTAADRRKMEKAVAILTDVLAERFKDKGANEMGSGGLRVWARLTSAQQNIASALRD
jgi:hypothetical protein